MNSKWCNIMLWTKYQNSLVRKNDYFKSYLTNYRFIKITPTTHVSNLQHLHLVLQNHVHLNLRYILCFISSAQHYKPQYYLVVENIWWMHLFVLQVLGHVNIHSLGDPSLLIIYNYIYIYLFLLVRRYSFICYYVTTIGRENIIK